MNILGMITDIIGLILLVLGVLIFAIEILGVIKYEFLLNRMHAAGMGDTLGISFSLLGLILINGFDFSSLKLFLVVVFLWFASPTSSHLIAKLEALTDETIDAHVDIRTDKEELL